MNPSTSGGSGREPSHGSSWRPAATALAVFLLGTCLVGVSPEEPRAARYDCGQPTSPGDGPQASDALTVLKAAVSLPTPCDTIPCICDVDGSGAVGIADAFRVLQWSVGQIPPLTCECGPSDIGCTSVEIVARSGSGLDLGWTGLGHGEDAGDVTFQAAIASRCAGDGDLCETDGDCGPDGPCEPTCNCANDSGCELTGPTHAGHCSTTLADCASDDDCPVGVECARMFGPPAPRSFGGTPVCLTRRFEGGLTGTMDVASGEVSLSFDLRSRLALGITLGQPCPRCGAPEETPGIGEEFTCEGGQFPGAACVVDGVHPSFGGTSFDCPAELSSSIHGLGALLRVRDLGTQTTTKQARLPCGNFLFKKNPLIVGSNPTCTDDLEAACASNADCLRCTGDDAMPCASNADCEGVGGTCAEAPDQPVTCGFWCHCGFCGNDPELGCFDDSDCPEGTPCVVGAGAGTQPNSAQQKPNDCSSDRFICGQSESEKCALSTRGRCTAQLYRNCTSDETCVNNQAGQCYVDPRPCFEPRITRTGTPSPLGSHCARSAAPCHDNADCFRIGEICEPRTMRPSLAALYCNPATASSAVNNAGGITGPAVLALAATVRVCHCGDGVLGCDEQCDDGNVFPEDGCDERCRME